VKDVRAAAKFYREVVGLTPETEADDAWAWFWAGTPGVTQRIALHKGTLLFEEHSLLPPEERWGRVHYAFQVERENLEAAVAHVRSAGVEVYGPTYFEWMQAKSYYFYDLDGNLLEWWSPEPETKTPFSR
jgi:catechol-2,3-dioxygenase